MNTITEDQIQSKRRIVETHPSGFIYKTTLIPMTQIITEERGSRMIVRVRGRESAELSCLLEISEATPIKSHQHGCLNMT